MSENASYIPVMEEFLTIQGEGFYAGRSAYFIRLEGCDVGCVWCDVKESWEITGKNNKPINEIVNRAVESKAGFVVVTGGEPFMHNLEELTNSLKEKGLELAVETSGAHPFSGSWHWVCFSPKKFKAPQESYFNSANELKVVVYNKHDLQWADSFADKMNDSCKLYLQPEWDRREQVLPLIIDYIRSNPRWNLSLQTHKYIGVP